MGSRHGVVLGLALAVTGGVAHADTATLRPANVTLSVPAGWQVMTERSGDFLHWETADDGGRSFDLSFERTTTACKAWRAEVGTRKEMPSYWPKRARTRLYTQRGDGKLQATGCLADTQTGAIVAHLEITAADPTYKPTKDDAAFLADALAAALAGATTATAVVAQPAPADGGQGKPGLPSPPPPSAPLDANALKGGTMATVPRVDLEVRLPKGTYWVVGARGEATIARADPDPSLIPLTATLFPLNARTCAEWRVDMSTNEIVTYEAKPAYLPSIVKAGVFVWMSGGTQFATCVTTKVGTLGMSIDYAGQLTEGDTKVVRQLIETVAVTASKHGDPLSAAPTLLDAGATADAMIGPVKLPAGAQWRVTNGAIERFDKGAYFSLSAMSRTSCSVSGGKPQPFLPAGLVGTVEAKPWGATVVKACIQTTRTIELTLAYNGPIAQTDHAVIRALVDAFVGASKKPSLKSSPKS